MLPNNCTVLLISDSSKPFTVITDALDFAIEVVLSQNLGEEDQPVAFKSRKLSPAKLNYPVHEKELQSDLFIITPLGKQKCVIVRRCDYIELPPYNHALWIIINV